MSVESTLAASSERSENSRWRSAGWFAALLLFLGYGVLLATHMGAWAGGSDSSGYLNHARLLRAGKVHEPLRVIEGFPAESMPGFAYVPLGFIPAGSREMTPTYPVGLPLLMAAVAPFTGWALAPHFTMWLHAMLGVGLMFALSRSFGLSRGSAFCGVLILAVCPLYLFMALQAMSDVPAMVWCTASVLFGWRSRTQPRWALAAGAAVGLAVLIRPSNLLIMVPAALCLGLNWRRWVWLALGGLPAAVFFAAYNHQLYGEPFATGYGAVGAIFAWEHVSLSLGNYLRWLPVLLTPAVFLALALPWTTKRETRLPAMICGAWAIAFTVFYAFYYHTHEQWWYLRFLLPAFPAFCIAMLLAGSSLLARWKSRIRFVVGSAAAIAIAAWGAYWTLDRWALDAGRGEKIYPDSARWARQHLPDNAVVAAMQASGALLYATDFTLVRYDHLSPVQLANLERFCLERQRPFYAILFPEERERVFGAMPGGWTQVGAVQHVTMWKRTPQTAQPAAPWHVLATTEDNGVEVTARSVADGWFDREQSRRHSWVWTSGPAALVLETFPVGDRRVALEFSLRALKPSVVTITQDGRPVLRTQVGTDRVPVRLTVEVKDGHARLDIASDTPGIRESERPDARVLSVAIYDLRLTLTQDLR